MKVAIIGGGAAGFFAAINVKENYPDANVSIYEKTSKLLSKVKVSGGGRCNLTNGSTAIKTLSNAYPRGKNQLKKLLHSFGTQDIRDWFHDRGVNTYVQDDLRVFPSSDSSQSVIDCFLHECKRLHIHIHTKANIKEITSIEDDRLLLSFEHGEEQTLDKVIVATGGQAKKENFAWLEKLGHHIQTPIPSLFTFNIPKHPITALMGLSAAEVLISIQGEKLNAIGPLLITHWGLSGPAVLKLSAFGAEILHQKDYCFDIQINWINTPNQEVAKENLQALLLQSKNKNIQSLKPFGLAQRLWSYFLDKAAIMENKKCAELGKKGLNKLVNILTADTYNVRGKTTFKEEFVTCGGISFESIHSHSMQSKVCPNLYFAGEVTNIDGITGGYNFQAAWTTAYIAAKLS